MPDLNFLITGTGSIAFVEDWAHCLGYKSEIPDQETGELIANPQTNVEYIIQNIFEHAKNCVSEYRIKEGLESAKVDIVSTVNTELSGISIEM